MWDRLDYFILTKNFRKILLPYNQKIVYCSLCVHKFTKSLVRGAAHNSSALKIRTVRAAHSSSGDRGRKIKNGDLCKFQASLSYRVCPRIVRAT